MKFTNSFLHFFKPRMRNQQNLKLKSKGRLFYSSKKLKRKEIQAENYKTQSKFNLLPAVKERKQGSI